MKRLLIVGAGGFGREVLQYAKDMQAVSKTWDYIEFINDDLHALDKFNKSHLIIDTITNYIPKENDEVMCAIGDSLKRYDIVNKLIKKGAVFTNIIHPTAIISPECTIGTGVIISFRAYVGPNSHLSNYVVVNGMSIIGHDSIVEQFSTIGPHCNVMGNVYIGERVYLGGSCCILPGIKVDNDSKIGVGSVVIKNVKEGISVFGNPAKKIYTP